MIVLLSIKSSAENGRTWLFSKNGERGALAPLITSNELMTWSNQGANAPRSPLGALTQPRSPDRHLSGHFTGTSPRSLVPDLAVAGGDNQGMVNVLLGNGDGTFQAPLAYALASITASLAVGDFNGDGHLDIAAVYAPGSASGLTILLG